MFFLDLKMFLIKCLFVFFFLYLFVYSFLFLGFKEHDAAVWFSYEYSQRYSFWVWCLFQGAGFMR